MRLTLDLIWRRIVDHPRSLLLGHLAITAFFLFHLASHGLPLDNSPESLMVSRDQVLNRYEEAATVFGSDRVMIVALLADDVFTPGVIDRLRSLTNRIEGVPGVSQAVSLTNTQIARPVDDGVSIGSIIPINASTADLVKAAGEVEQNEFLLGNLVSPDRKMVAVNIFFATGRGEIERRAAAEIERIARVESSPYPVYFAGLPYMDYRNDVHVTRDLTKFAPLTVLLVLVTFFFAFRTWRGLAMPLVTVALALIWTFGVMAIMNRPLTLVTMMLPVIIMAIGSSYVIHVLNQFNLSGFTLGHRPSREDGRIVILHALRFIGPAVIVSGTTTMAGFSSLAFTSIAGMRDMGIFNAVGTAFTLILTLTFVPAWLILLKPIPRAEAGPTRRSPVLEAILHWTGSVVTRRHMLVYGIVAAITLLSVVGIFALQTNTDYLRFYPEGSQERVGAEKLHEHMGGAAGFRIIVDGHQVGALRRVTELKSMEALQRFVETLPGVGRTLSIADLVKLTNRVFRSGTIRDQIIPDDQDAVNGLFQQLDESGDDPAIRFISEDGSRAQILVRTNVFGSSELDQMIRRIDSWTGTHFPAGFTTYATGVYVLLNRTSDMVAGQQTRSLIIALGLIFVMMALLFGSFKVGGVALLPNIIPIVAFFGFMGWTGIPLNLNTSLVASVVLGLAVDNAAHMIRRYRQYCVVSQSRDQAVIRSLRDTGPPMIYANMTLVFAFAIFALSTFLPVRAGGLLSAVTILACLVSNLVFLPVLMNSRWLQVGEDPALPESADTVGAARAD